MANYSDGFYNFLLHGHEYRFDIGWIVKELLRQGKVVDSIDEKIEAAVNEAVSDERITQIVADIISTLSGVVNVKVPPAGLTAAKGDGTANDGDALQAIIDYLGANGGGIAFFPQGAYLSNSLTIPEGVSLYGMGRYDTRLVAAGGLSRPLITSTAGHTSIQNMTVDASMSVQVNNVTAVSLMGRDYLLSDLIINDAYTGIQFVGDGHLQADNIILTNIINKGVITARDNATVSMDNVEVLSGGSYVVSAFDLSTVNGMYTNLRSIIPVNDHAILLSGSHNYITADVQGTEHKIDDTGVGNSYTLYNDIVKEQINNRQDVIAGDLTITAEDIDLTGNKHVYLSGEDVILKPTEPLTYGKTLTRIDDLFRAIPAKLSTGEEYNILVQGGKLENIAKILSYEPVNVLTLGFDNTGNEDVGALINQYTEMYALFFPIGTYLINTPVTLKKPIFGVNATNGLSVTPNSSVTTFVTASLSTGFMLNCTDNNTFFIVDGIQLALLPGVGGIQLAATGSRINIENVSIYQLCNANGISIRTNTSRAAVINNLLVNGDATENSCIAIDVISASDVWVRNYMARSVKNGFTCNGATAFMSDAHIWCGLPGGVSADWWRGTAGMTLNSCDFVGTNIYLDTAYNNIVNFNGSVINIDGLTVWYDAAPSATGISSANLMSDESNTARLNICGGMIYGNVYYQNTARSNVSLSGVVVASDSINVLTPVSYPVCKENWYTVTNSDAYQEVARIVWGTDSSLTFTVRKNNNAVTVNASKSGETVNITKTKLTENNLTVFYKVQNGYLLIYGTAGTYNVTIDSNTFDSRAVIYPFNRKADRKTAYERLGQADASGLTAIPDAVPAQTAT